MNGVFTLKNTYCLVLAGGSGTRLWPLSRDDRPKQFLKLDTESLYQGALRRVFRIAGPTRTRVLSGVRFGATALVQARELEEELPQSFVVEEPCPRNTAPAIALGLLRLMEECGATRESLVFVCPSDHVIDDLSLFEKVVLAASSPAREGRIVVFGIPPSRPDTGFGYIRAGMERGEWREVECFVEKPGPEKAREYVEDGRYFWNGGMLMFTVGAMLDALTEHLTDVAEVLPAGARAFLEVFPSMPSISMDYAVLERIKNIALVPLESPWTDIGSWDALYDFLERDGEGNAVMGRTVAEGCVNSLLLSTGRLVAAVGISDLLVIESPDAVLVAPRGESQKVRLLVDRLRGDGAPEVVGTRTDAGKE